MDLINPIHSTKSSRGPRLSNFVKNVNPVFCVPPRVGATGVCILDLILTFASIICGLVLVTYLIHPAGFPSREHEEAPEAVFRDQYIVTSMTKIYIFLIIVGMLAIGLAEYGLFTVLWDGVRQDNKHLCGLWFEIRFVMFCAMLGGYTTYGLVMRADSFVTETLLACPFFLWKFYALWIVKHFQYNIVTSAEREKLTC